MKGQGGDRDRPKGQGGEAGAFPPSTPVTPKLVREHGLTEEEYRRVIAALGREPNITELGIFSVMWSEHCSYKSSRLSLKELPTEGPRVLQGPGENAGIVDVGEGRAIAFKMESHNHPSFIEPYQGAATGVGGILRDIFTMGARPIASLNSLRFGSPLHPRTSSLVRGVVAGIGGYGNTMGIPTVGGEILFDECYDGNILVNVFTLGVLDAQRIFRGRASGAGNPVLVVGSKTGRDGIHGATMASDTFGQGGEERRPTVQVGDPFTEKLLLEACLELMATDAIEGIQDMGAAGLACSSFEMADRGGVGMELDLDRVPKRAEGMTPYEIMLSESQERMLLVLKREREAEAMRIFEKWDLDAAVVGSVAEGGRVRLFQGGELVGDVPVAPVVRGAPIYERPAAEPSWQREVQRLELDDVPLPGDLNAVLFQLMGSPNLACKRWVWEQYDHMVMAGTVCLPGGDGAVVRLPGSNRGIAISTDGNGRYAFLDPYAGAILAVAEGARNVSCAGAEPLAITNCLNFGDPERPEIMWQFRQAVAGLAEGCRRFGTPVTGGNVSFYNETKGRAIHPTPVVGMVGLVEDVGCTCTPWWKSPGDVILLVGGGEPGLGGSEYLKQIHGRVAGLPPRLDCGMELALQRAVRAGIRQGLVRSAHDISDGGLAVALAECSLGGREGLFGVAVEIERSARPDVLLFGEAASRVLVSVSPRDVQAMLRLTEEEGVPAKAIGTVGGKRFIIQGLLDAELSELLSRWQDAYPDFLGK